MAGSGGTRRAAGRGGSGRGSSGGDRQQVVLGALGGALVGLVIVGVVGWLVFGRGGGQPAATNVAATNTDRASEHDAKEAIPAAASPTTPAATVIASAGAEGDRRVPREVVAGPAVSGQSEPVPTLAASPAKDEQESAALATYPEELQPPAPASLGRAPDLRPAPVEPSLRMGDVIADLAFSPDGRTLLSAVTSASSRRTRQPRPAAQGPNFLLATDVGTGYSKWKVDQDEGPLIDVAWSGDGRRVAVLVADSTTVRAKIYDAATGAKIAVTPPSSGGGGVNVVAFAPDDATIRFWAQGGEFLLHDVATGVSRSKVPFESASVRSLFAAGDGNTLAYTTERRSGLTVKRIEPLGTATEFPEWGPYLQRFALSQDGRFVALHYQKPGEVRPLIVVRDVVDGETVSRFRLDVPAKVHDNVEEFIRIALSPDGRFFAGYIAPSDPWEGLVVWRVSDGIRVAALPADTRITVFTAIAMSPDNRLLAGGDNRGNVLLWIIPANGH
ncbi:MAG: hypothetical protein WD066_15575 [Planctomycetaceae bacterium]